MRTRKLRKGIVSGRQDGQPEERSGDNQNKQTNKQQTIVAAMTIKQVKGLRADAFHAGAEAGPRITLETSSQ